MTRGFKIEKIFLYTFFLSTSTNYAIHNKILYYSNKNKNK